MGREADAGVRGNEGQFPTPLLTWRMSLRYCSSGWRSPRLMSKKHYLEFDVRRTPFCGKNDAIGLELAVGSNDGMVLAGDFTQPDCYAFRVHSAAQLLASAV